MKTPALPLLAALLCLSARAEEPATFARLETLSGKVYEQARVSRVELDAAVVMHSGGVARVEAADLAEEVRARIPFDLDGAAKAKAAKEAAETAARKAAELDRLCPLCEVRVQQVVEGGVLGNVMAMAGTRIMTGELQFVALDAEALGIVDGDCIAGIRLRKLDDAYTYINVLGARSTIPAWQHCAVAGQPAPSKTRYIDGPEGPGQQAVNRLLR